ncbi:MAG: biotin/lipoyl-binding protein [Elainella sp.]
MSLHLSKGLAPKWAGLLLAATALTGGLSYSVVSQFFRPSQPQPQLASQPQQIGALGRLEPASQVINLSAPLALDGDRVRELRVKAGDRVQAGQVIAVMDSQTRLQAAWQQAKARVASAEARLNQVRAGAKTGEIAAQQAAIARLQAELQGQEATQLAEIARWQAEVSKATADLQRFQTLFQQGAIAAATLDDKQLALQTTQAQLRQAQAQQDQTRRSTLAQIEQAQATLNQIAEVRPVDLQAAQREVDEARVALAQAQTDLDQAEIRAPIAAQVLKVHTRAGEKLGDRGLVDLAQTEQMVAVAEVYQSDIAAVKLGQPARITGDFGGELQGTVAEIGLQVLRQNVFSNEPGENLDQRVVEVKIRLSPSDSQKVAGLTNLQVQANIQVSPPAQPEIQPDTQPETNQPETSQSETKLETQAQVITPVCGAFSITNNRFRLNRLC